MLMPQHSTITTLWWEHRLYSSRPPPSVTSVDLLSANWTWIVAYAAAQWGSNHINKQVHNDFGILYSCASLASLPLYLWWIALVHAGESSCYRTHLPIILAFAPDRKKDFQMHWTALKSAGYRGNEGMWMESFSHPHTMQQSWQG